MRKSKPVAARMTMLAAILMLAGCSSVGIDPFGRPIVVRASTFCEVYEPVRAGDAAGFWDALEAEFPEQSAVIRGNNLAWTNLCDAEAISR